MDVSKVAFASELDYPNLALDYKGVLTGGATATIPHGLDYVPVYRLWVELFVGEVSASFMESNIFYYMDDYSNAGIGGFETYADETNIYVESLSPTRNIYVRVYR